MEEYNESKYRYGYITKNSRCEKCKYPIGNSCHRCDNTYDNVDLDTCLGCGMQEFIIPDEQCYICSLLESRGADDPGGSATCRYCGKRFSDYNFLRICLGCQEEPLEYMTKPAKRD